MLQIFFKIMFKQNVDPVFILYAYLIFTHALLARTKAFTIVIFTSFWKETKMIYVIRGSLLNTIALFGMIYALCICIHNAYTIPN